MFVDSETSRGLGRWKAASFVVPLALMGVLVASQGIWFARAQPVIRAPVETGRPFLIRNIPNGTTMSQRLEVQANGLRAIELSGVIDGPPESGAIDAILVELFIDGSERRIRQARSKPSVPCCSIPFEPVEESADKRYRLDLEFVDFGASSTLALWARPHDEDPGMAVNGRQQRARLVLAASAVEGTAIARIAKSAGPLTLRGLLFLLFAFDIAVAYGIPQLVRVFVNASDPARP